MDLCTCGVLVFGYYVFISSLVKNENCFIMEHFNKQRHNHFFWHYDLTGYLKRVLKMAEIKGIVLLFNTLGWSAYAYGFLIAFFNVDTFTRAVMGLLGIVFVAFKIIDGVATRRRKHEFEMIEIRMKKLEEKERELRIRREELDLYNRENDIIKGFD